jgi:hypothetical protein
VTECGRELRLPPAGNYVFDGRLRRLSAELEVPYKTSEKDERHEAFKNQDFSWAGKWLRKEGD